MRRGLLAALGAVALLALPLALPPQLLDTDAQSVAAPAYEIEVLPGVADSDPTNEKRWSIDAAGNATMTSGWHLGNSSIDLRGSSSSDHDDIVVARFRVVTNPTVEGTPGLGTVLRIYAVVSEIRDTDDDEYHLCRKVRLEIYDAAVQEDGKDKLIGELTYTHIDPDDEIEEGDLAPLTDGAGRLQLGAIISAATDSALGDDCDNFGDHLHQQARLSGSGNALWRNYDRADRRADDGMGFDPGGWGYGYLRPYPRFCADTWIFKIYPPTPAGQEDSEHAPLATPVEKCAAPDNAPSSLSVSEGDGTLDLSWTAPELVSAENEQVTGYQVRWRQTPDGAWEDWESTATTSYTISDLTNDTTYAAQVRAVNSAAKQTVKHCTTLAVPPTWCALKSEHPDRGILEAIPADTMRTIPGAGPPATINATPSRPLHSLTTIARPATGGTVTAEPLGEPGDQPNRRVHPMGTVVTLEAKPASDHVFLDWEVTVGDSTVMACGNPTKVKLDADTTAEAVFEVVPGGVPPHSLTITLAPPPRPEAWAAGFGISGCSGLQGTAGSGGAASTTEAETTVRVTITRAGETTPAATLGPVTADASGGWSVQVPPNASYISDGEYDVAATATRGAFSATRTARFSANVAPTISYTAPTSLRVGTAVTISPSTTDTDIASYVLKTGSTLPSGLTLNATSGVISGTPSAATAARTLTIVVTDRAKNAAEVELSLPAVAAAQPPPPP
ncbi:MAG: hypothetical protein F4X25_10395, partial [Chloroflexi bacterium]|nr:hypothetical protein [Chloroflexota bacterium]